MFVILNFSYHSHNNIRIQASLEIALEDAYISIADPEFFDPDHTEILVEPNDDGINAVFGQIKVINNSFDLEITYVSLVFLI